MLTGLDFRSLTFSEPIDLWLLVVPAILLLLWLWKAWRRRRDAQRCARGRVLPVRERFALTGDLAFWLCLIVATSFCIAAVARPQGRISTITETGGADIVILQDGSASMAVQDVMPDRWQRSVEFIRAFSEVLSWKGDRVALAIFAHQAAPQTRLTNDPNALFFFLDHLGEHSPFRLDEDPSWDTNIEEGLHWGMKLVDTDEEMYGKSANAKGFVVITDGQAWSGDVAKELVNANQRHFPVYVVGVGTTAGGPIPGPPSGYVNGIPLPPIDASLDRDSLRQIARTGGGEYFELGNQPDRDVALKIIAGVRRRSVVKRQEVDSYEDFYWRFLGAAAVFLCLGTFLLKGSTELWWQAAVAAAVLLTLASVIH
jgi:Ca-activated chloride channel homolog